jgi:hypothetical protein
VSRELRTPLATMPGKLMPRYCRNYRAPPEKFLPILTHIRSNGQHLLDISKIEAGQFELNLGECASGSIV